MLRRLLATRHPLTVNHDAGRLDLVRSLGPWGLTALGIGAVIGGGIFVITGQAAAEHAGPAIVLSFVLAAICCTFCALAYAEFASLVPVSGSLATGLWATALHSAGYLVVTGLIAVIVYRKVGLRMLRTMWINLDLIWGGALVVTGTVALLT